MLDKFATRTCLFTVLQRIRVTPTGSYNYNLEATIILAMYLGANWTRPSLSLASLTFALVFLLVSLALLFLAHFPCHMHTGQRLGQHVNYFSSCIRASPTKLLFLAPYFSHMRTSHPVSLSYFKMYSNKPLIFAPLLSTLSYFIDMDQLP